MARSIFITGASSGIGASLALEFARRGYDVALAARRQERLEELARDLSAAGARRVLTYPLDVVQYDSIAPALEQAAREFGRLDIVVANAGIGATTPVGKGHFDPARRTVETNLLGAIATIEAAVALFRAQDGGQVVGITSMAAWRGLPGLGAYSASKAGLHRYLQSLRAEVGRDSIVVTELAPGYIDTDMNRGLGARPFVIPVDRGAALMARMIERKVGYRTVPVLPWSLLGPLLTILPGRLFVRRQSARRAGAHTKP